VAQVVASRHRECRSERFIWMSIPSSVMTPHATVARLAAGMLMVVAGLALAQDRPAAVAGSSASAVAANGRASGAAGIETSRRLHRQRMLSCQRRPQTCVQGAASSPAAQPSSGHGAAERGRD